MVFMPIDADFIVDRNPHFSSGARAERCFILGGNGLRKKKPTGVDDGGLGASW